MKLRLLLDLIGALALGFPANAATLRISELPETNRVPGSGLLVVEAGGTRAVTLSNTLDSLKRLPNWPTNEPLRAATNLSLSTLGLGPALAVDTNTLVVTNGQVGIGHSTPQSPLDVYRVDENAANVQRVANFVHTTTSTPANGMGASVGLLGANDTGAETGGILTYSLSNVTNGNETGLWEFGNFENGNYASRLVIAGSKVGIGTNNPRWNLHVAGTNAADYFVGNGSLLTGVASGNNPVFTGLLSGSNATFSGNVTNAGAVKVNGTLYASAAFSGPFERFTLSAPAPSTMQINAARVAFNNVCEFAFSNAPTRVVFKGQYGEGSSSLEASNGVFLGAVGIGTANPAASLHVVGDGLQLNGLKAVWVTNQYLAPGPVTNTMIYLGFQ
jgi:hypothetical protein